MTRKAWLEYLQKAVDEFDWDAVEQEQGEPSYAERLLAHVEDFAKRCGWSKESGEGAFECVQRTSYAQGVEDGKLQRLQEQRSDSEHLGEPVAWMDKENHDVIVSAKDWDNIDPLWYWMYQPLYTTPQPTQRPKVVFPTMLRKMWSGGEVQAWLDENVNKGNGNA